MGPRLQPCLAPQAELLHRCRSLEWAAPAPHRGRHRLSVQLVCLAFQVQPARVRCWCCKRTPHPNRGKAGGRMGPPGSDRCDLQSGLRSRWTIRRPSYLDEAEEPRGPPEQRKPRLSCGLRWRPSRTRDGRLAALEKWRKAVAASALIPPFGAHHPRTGGARCQGEPTGAGPVRPRRLG